MVVYLRLYSTLVKYLKGARAGEAVIVETAVGSAVSDLIATLGIEKEEVFLISVNSQVEGPDYVLQAGDAVSLFGPIAGGARN